MRFLLLLLPVLCLLLMLVVDHPVVQACAFVGTIATGILCAIVLLPASRFGRAERRNRVPHSNPRRHNDAGDHIYWGMGGCGGCGGE